MTTKIDPRQPLSERSRVQNLRELSDRMEVLAREFKRLVDVVSDNQVQEPYLALVESCGAQVNQTLGHVGTMVDTLNAMAYKPTYARQFIVAPRDVPFYRSLLP